MMDAVLFEAREYLLLGDLNFHLLKQNKHWLEKPALFNLTQLVASPTRITEKSQTLPDDTSVSNQTNSREVLFPLLAAATTCLCAQHGANEALQFLQLNTKQLTLLVSQTL